jgi:hypothetical protein
MRCDAEVSHARIGGQDEIDRRWQVAGAPVLLEQMGDGGGADRLPIEGLGERAIEGGS